MVLGTKKAELELAQLLETQRASVNTVTLPWPLPIGFTPGACFAAKPEPNTLESSARKLAPASLAVLESVGLAYRTFIATQKPQRKR